MPPFLSDLLFAPRFRALRLRWALFLYAAIVFMGSIPGVRADIGRLASGLVLHTLAYASITFLLFGGLRGTARRRALTSIAWVVAMGAFDELVQAFLPYRRGSALDWAVDVNASCIMAALLWRFWPRTPLETGGRRAA